MKQSIKAISPNIKVTRLNCDAVKNCPTTIPVNINLPTSYNAFASSLRWFLSNIIFSISLCYYFIDVMSIIIL